MAALSAKKYFNAYTYIQKTSNFQYNSLKNYIKNNITFSTTYNKILLT